MTPRAPLTPASPDFVLAAALLGALLDDGGNPGSRVAGLLRDAFGAGDALCLPAGRGGYLATPPSWRSLVEKAAEGPVSLEDESGGRIGCPLRDGDAFLGVVCLTGRAFTQTDMARLEALAGFLGRGLALRNAQEERRKETLETEEELDLKSQIIDQIHDSVIAMDLGGYITSWNKGAEHVFGYTAEEAIGRNILFLYADEDEEDVLLNPAFFEHGGREMVVRRRKKSGEVFWASLSLSIFHDREGNPAGLVGYLVDITERLRSEEQLRLQAAIFEYSDEGILVTDAEGRIVSVNRAFTKITGYGADEVLGKTPDILRSGFHDDGFYMDMATTVRSTGHWIGEVWNRRKNGEPFPVWQSTSTVHNRDGAITHYFSVFTDITERKNAENQIYRLAYYDMLTGLPNRAMLHTLIKQALVEAQRNKFYGAILFIDLDRFKQVNDSLGPTLGDKLLEEVARLIRDCLRSEDVVARVGGDEFVVALFDITRREHASIVAGKIRDALASPIVLEDGQELHMSASIGISVYPDDGDDPETLIKNADAAMSRVKQGEGQDGHLFYSSDMNRRALERLQLEANLRRALERDELQLYYQPQLSLATGELVGAEVLLRWNHPGTGMISPGQFIPVAEETGLIVAIGDWVLETACRKNRQWQEEGLQVVKLSVNLSARQFRASLPRQVEDILQRSGLPPELLELEITESMVMKNADAVIELMDAFQSLGVSLALDDFGTGYSSLSYLKRFPIQKLKMDQSFVRGLPDDANDTALARAIISLAKNLNLKVIAEGVETLEQLQFLKYNGCDEIQGYHYSRPMPELEYLDFLQQAKIKS